MNPFHTPTTTTTTSPTSSSPNNRTTITSTGGNQHQHHDDDDDDMTEINIDEGEHTGGSNFVSRLERIHGRNNANGDGTGAGGGTSRFFWSEDEERAYEEQRRERLNEELLRVQKKNFIHFTILCMVPIFLLVLVLVSSLTSKNTCNGYEIASCQYEERSFMNAFARRCICTAFDMK
jgi:hypothetical protein